MACDRVGALAATGTTSEPSNAAQSQPSPFTSVPLKRSLSMHSCSSSGCNAQATHILVDYYHMVIGRGRKFCFDHAFDEGRERCPCCDDYEVEHNGEEFLPTYPSGALDEENCCSEHP